MRWNSLAKTVLQTIHCKQCLKHFKALETSITIALEISRTKHSSLSVECCSRSVDHPKATPSFRRRVACQAGLLQMTTHRIMRHTFNFFPYKVQILHPLYADNINAQETFSKLCYWSWMLTKLMLENFGSAYKFVFTPTISHGLVVVGF